MKKVARVVLLGLSALTTFELRAVPASDLETSSYEEAFLVRRIAEFFKDGDYDLVKTQINDFFARYPNSPLNEHLHGVLGDLFIEEGHYEKALAQYEAITDEDVISKIFLNKLQCYYELSNYEAISEAGLALSSEAAEGFADRKDEFNFLMAESFYRRALKLHDRNEKRSFAVIASNYYEELLESAYADTTLFSLADIYTIVGEDQQAALAYLSLAKTHPKMEEQLLFNAASCMAQFDRDQAIDTYEELISLDGPHAKEARFNQLILLFEKEEYQQVIEAFPSIASVIPDNQATLFKYILGKCYFSQDQYKEALEPLTAFIKASDADEAYLKNALLISMTCAYNLGDSAQFSDHLAQFKVRYSDDAQLPNAIFMHAMLSKDAGDDSTLLKELENLLTTYTDFEQREGLLYEYTFATHKCGLHANARESAQSYLKDYAGSEREGAVWKLYLASSLEVYKNQLDLDEPTYSRQSFFDDLKTVLSKESLLKGEEKGEYQLLFATVAFELGRFESAYSTLEAFSKHTKDNVQAEFLMGLCQHQMGGDAKKMVSHFETVLTLDENHAQKGLIHLYLFNGYLSFDEDMAAEHLFEAVKTASHPVKAENRLWLADRLYTQAKPYMDNSYLLSETEQVDMESLAVKGCDLYASVFYSNGGLVSIDQETLYLEPEALKFAELLGVAGKHHQKISLLTELAEKQDANPDWDWMFQRSTLFELAKAYEMSGDLEMALETYTFISDRERGVSSPILNIATFQSAKLRFTLLDDRQKTKNNNEVHEILTQLKELQIRRHVDSEPIHLEASLEYAMVRSAISSAAERNQRYLFFLNRMVEDATSQEDAISIGYHRLLGKSPEKKLVFDTYMKFVEAEKLRLKGIELREANLPLEAEEVNEQALALLFDIEGVQQTRDYLHPRVLKSIEAISDAESY